MPTYWKMILWQKSTWDKMGKSLISKQERQEPSVDIKRDAEVVICMIKNEAQERDINISTHIDHTLPMLFGDNWQIKQILTRLLSNAIKFTPPRGLVSLNIKYTYPAGFFIAITDTSVGMGSTESLINVLLEIQPMIKSHDGTFHIERSQDQGTTVRVCFPNIKSMSLSSFEGLLSVMLQDDGLDKD